MYVLCTGDWDDVWNFWLWTLPNGRVFATDCPVLAHVAAEFESLPGILDWRVWKLNDGEVEPTHPTPQLIVERLISS